MDFQKIDSHLLSHSRASKAFHEKWRWMIYWMGGKQLACELAAKHNEPLKKEQVRVFS